MTEPKSSRDSPCSSRSFSPIFVFSFLLGSVFLAQCQNQRHLDSIRPFVVGWSRDTDLIAVDTSQYYTCDFRNHSRFYGLSSESYPPAFLRSAFYIHGKPPILLPLSSSSSSTKICSRPSPLQLQLEIQNTTTGQNEVLPLTQPLMDGTNPTLVSLRRLQRELSPSSVDTLQFLWQTFPTAVYLVSNTFKSANQCDYDHAKQKKEKHNKNNDKGYVVTDKKHPPGREHRNEVDLMLVDAQFRTLWQTTIVSTTPPKYRLSADDARLLVHNGDLFLTFKRYGDHGGNGSVLYLAKLKGMVHDTEGTRVLQIHAVREWAMCCGRNFMALSSPLSEDDDSDKMLATPSTKLSFLTWPDPIWVQSLDTSAQEDATSPISIAFQSPKVSTNDNGKTSKFHGTSGFLLYLADTREYLGIGHLHRERKWAKDFRVDAKFGHHYTHAFFTMSSLPPYHLTRLSQEFLFPSTAHPKDADIIQFSSGLEWAQTTSAAGGRTTTQRQIIIAYGINDCEGAVVKVDWDTVQGLLRRVPEGSQVVHAIANMTREDFLQVVHM